MLDRDVTEIDRNLLLLDVMTILAQSSKRFPSSFFVSVHPPLDPGETHLAARTGRHTDLFLKEYSNQRVAVKRIRTHTWRLSSPEREDLQNVGLKSSPLRHHAQTRNDRNRTETTSCLFAMAAAPSSEYHTVIRISQRLAITCTRTPVARAR